MFWARYYKGRKVENISLPGDEEINKAISYMIEASDIETEEDIDFLLSLLAERFNDGRFNRPERSDTIRHRRNDQDAESS